MPHVEGSMVIRAPVEHVYAYLSDVTRITEWRHDAASARWISNSRGTSGARAEVVFRIAGQPIPTEMLVLKAAPPRELVLRGMIGVQVTYAWRLEPHPEGTRVTRRIDWALPPGTLRRELDAMYLESPATASQDLEKVKMVLEGHTREHGGY